MRRNSTYWNKSFFTYNISLFLIKKKKEIRDCFFEYGNIASSREFFCKIKNVSKMKKEKKNCCFRRNCKLAQFVFTFMPVRIQLRLCDIIKLFYCFYLFWIFEVKPISEYLSFLFCRKQGSDLEFYRKFCST